MINAEELRERARLRAASRPLLPFAGSVSDDNVDGIALRRYVPHQTTRHLTAYFAHGGYGLFGDLNLQDAYCRQMSTIFGCQTVSVDYRLAPEHTFREAVEDVVRCVRAERTNDSVLLCGDSAGGALAVASATILAPRISALVLSNPNLDLTLGLFDRSAPAGPDWGTSLAAFTAWSRPLPLTAAPRLHRQLNNLPPTFVAVGALDALRAESESLAEGLRENGRPCRLLTLPEHGHGFMSDATTASSVLTKARDFVDDLSRTY